MFKQSKYGIYYGWLIVAAGFFISMIGVGAYSGFGVFVIPMSEEFGWNRATVSLAASIGALAGGFSQPFMGRIFDRIGGRRLIMAGLIFSGAANLLLSFTNHIIHLILVFGVVMAISDSAGTMNTAVSLVARWFHRRRATAIAIISAGTSMGGLVLVPFVAFAIPLVGWRNTWLILGLFLLCLALPVAYLIIRNDPSEVGSLPDGDVSPAGRTTAASIPRGPLEVDYWMQAFGSVPFWQLLGGYFVCGVSTAMISVHYVPYAIEEGFSPSVAATAFGLMSALNIAGVMLAGMLGDRLGRKNLLALVYLTRGVGFLVLLTAPGLWGLFGFAVISGFSWVATVPLTTSLTAEVYGLKNIGTLSGIVYMAHQIGGALSIQFSGIMKDVTGDYTIPFAIAGLCLLFASVVSFSIQERRYSSRYVSVPEPATTQHTAV